MARYIDADQLYALVDKAHEIALNKLLDTPKTLSDGELNPMYIRGLTLVVERAQFKEEIFDAPTADVVEVVRCKDCLYWRRETEPIGIECEPGETAHYCSFSGITRSNEFCCWGANESKMLKAFEEIRKRRKENEEQQGKSRSEEGSGDPEA